MRHQIWSYDPEANIPQVRSLDDQVNESLAPERSQASRSFQLWHRSSVLGGTWYLWRSFLFSLQKGAGTWHTYRTGSSTPQHLCIDHDGSGLACCRRLNRRRRCRRICGLLDPQSPIWGIPGQCTCHDDRGCHFHRGLRSSGIFPGPASGVGRSHKGSSHGVNMFKRESVEPQSRPLCIPPSPWATTGRSHELTRSARKTGFTIRSIPDRQVSDRPQL